MAGNIKLMTSAGGGVVLDTATTTATDVTVKVPVTGVNNGTLVCSDSSGNVGIGTSSPSDKLHVIGNAKLGSAGYIFFLNSANDYSAWINNSASGGDGNLTFYVGGTATAKMLSSHNFQFNSGYGSVATAYGCRAWVNFNGTGTVAIRGSGNVSSITDNGTGDYTVNITNAMPDANYGVSFGYGTSATSSHTSQLEVAYGVAVPTASAIRLRAEYGGTYPNDIPYISVSVFR